MHVLGWVVEGTWPATVDALRAAAGPDAEVTLVHVVDPGIADSAHSAFAGLMGRGRRPDPGALIDAAARQAGQDLLAAAADRLGRPAELLSRSGRTEREVVAACAGADLLVVARDGDLQHVGPRSLGPATRFVVDHAPCAVLLVWPRPPADTRPPPPPPPGHRPPPPPRH